MVNTFVWIIFGAAIVAFFDYLRIYWGSVDDYNLMVFNSVDEIKIKIAGPK